MSEILSDVDCIAEVIGLKCLNATHVVHLWAYGYQLSNMERMKKTGIRITTRSKTSDLYVVTFNIRSVFSRTLIILLINRRTI